MTNSRVDVAEYTDPLCSVAWGAEPLFRLFRWRYGAVLNWRSVMGGLIGDASKGDPAWNRITAAQPMEKYWRRVTQITGQPYPKPMHIMPQSTDPAGRAYRAAALQGMTLADRILRRTRESIFLFGRGPQTDAEFTEIAAGITGLDVPRWLADMKTPGVETAYQADWEECRSPNAYVRAYHGDHVMAGNMRHDNGRDRYDYPTVIFKGPGGEHTVPGWLPFEAYVEALEAALPGATANPRPDPTPAEAFAEWGVMTARELAVICGEDAKPPAEIVTYDWGDGVAYFRKDEATAWGIG